jgi:hypothetical protein
MLANNNKWSSSNEGETSTMEMYTWTWNHNSNVSNKPLGQSLGSKVNQKAKIELDIQHESYLINQEQVLKRTKPKSKSKVMWWAREVKGTFRAYIWTLRIKIPNQNRNDSNNSGKIHEHSKHSTWSSYKKSEST